MSDVVPDEYISDWDDYNGDPYEDIMGFEISDEARFRAIRQAWEMALGVGPVKAFLISLEQQARRNWHIPRGGDGERWRRCWATWRVPCSVRDVLASSRPHGQIDRCAP